MTPSSGEAKYLSDHSRKANGRPWLYFFECKIACVDGGMRGHIIVMQRPDVLCGKFIPNLSPTIFFFGWGFSESFFRILFILLSNIFYLKFSEISFNF